MSIKHLLPVSKHAHDTLQQRYDALLNLYTNLIQDTQDLRDEYNALQAAVREEVQVHSCGYTCLFMSHTLIGAGWVDLAKTKKLINCPQCKARLTKELMVKAEPS